jgi:hypothetical protein
MKPGQPTAQYNAYLALRPPGHLHRPTAACPVPRAPTRAHRRRGGTVGRLPPHAGTTDQLATSAPRVAHATATSSCVPHFYLLRSCHAEAKFFSVSSPLASALPLPRELAVATISRPPCRRPNRGTRSPPSPHRVALRSSSRRGPPAPELARHQLRFLRFTGHRRPPPPVLLQPR